MSKIWQVMPVVKKDFIKKFSDYNQLTLQLLFNRGLVKKREIENFLHPDYKNQINDPYFFRQMKEAVDLIADHIKKRNKITVYGDYDADGVTASVVLSETLKTLKGTVEVYIPDRFSEGYGLNRDAIDEIAAAQTKLIITVDSGIRNKEEVDYAKELGVDIIITDHHLPSSDKKDLPDCLIINAQLSGEKYPYKFLSGVGVAAKLAQAIIDRSKINLADKEVLKEKILDLVSIGTVADCVSLLGENRILVKEGLGVLNKNKRVGLQELLSSGIIKSDKKIESWNIAFQIAPRLNAAGRMDHANTAFELLATNNRKEAQILVKNLNNKNSKRQNITKEIVRQIEKQAEKEKKQKIIIALSPSITGGTESWSEGVIGLIAGRIAEKYHLPTLVITGEGDEMKGSGRSIEGFNLVKMTEESKEFLEKFGGHAAACGFSIKGKNNLDKFVVKAREVAKRKLSKMDLMPKLLIEAKISLSQVDEKLLELIKEFEPFGTDNQKPSFLSNDLMVVDKIIMGDEGQHVKFIIRNKEANLKNALSFGKADKWKDINIGDKVDIVYFVESNEFNGKSEVQLKVIDIKKQ